MVQCCTVGWFWGAGWNNSARTILCLNFPPPPTSVSVNISLVCNWSNNEIPGIPAWLSSYTEFAQSTQIWMSFHERLIKLSTVFGMKSLSHLHRDGSLQRFILCLHAHSVKRVKEKTLKSCDSYKAIWRTNISWKNPVILYCTDVFRKNVLYSL
jgi:hypothetical protein